MPFEGAKRRGIVELSRLRVTGSGWRVRAVPERVYEKSHRGPAALNHRRAARLLGAEWPIA
ncbi:hypothetical protein GCM10007856_01970 [Azospirillum oryzae]|nr:hypothetical protein GCM10007856_01970 [Azospirillum oryzae]